MDIRTGQLITIDPTVKYRMASEHIARCIVAQVQQFMPQPRTESAGSCCQFVLVLPDHPSFPGDVQWRRTLAIQVRDVADLTFKGVNRIKKKEGEAWTLHVTDPKGHRNFESWALNRLSAVSERGDLAPLDLQPPRASSTTWPLSTCRNLKAWYPEGLAQVQAHCPYPHDAAASFISQASQPGALHDRLCAMLHQDQAWHFEGGAIRLLSLDRRRQALDVQAEGDMVTAEATHSRRCLSC